MKLERPRTNKLTGARSLRTGKPPGRPTAPHRPRTSKGQQAFRPKSGLIAFTIFSLAFPIYFFVGPVRLTPYRVMLLVAFLPCIVKWISGAAGRVRAPDLLILVASLWGALALIVNGGLGPSIEPAGILVLETFGAYLVGRILIRQEEDFLTFVKFFTALISFFIPFAILESLTDRAFLLEILGVVFKIVGRGNFDPRFGLHRAQVLFEHPILYGSFCASGLGLAYYAVGYGRKKINIYFRSFAIFVASFCSLSVGAIAAIVTQVIMILWDHATRTIPNRWRTFGLLLVSAYIFIDLLSNRTPFHVIVTYLSFNARSAYNRILVWHFGTAEVWRHPIFGIGLNDWVRPSWMSSSMDNFWLVIAVRYGLPAFICFALGIVLLMRALGQANLKDEQLRAYRAGLLIALCGMIVSGSTVHYWNAIYVWFNILVGSGVWMITVGEQSSDAPESHDPKSENEAKRRLKFPKPRSSPRQPR